MANSPQARKRARQAERSRARNQVLRSRVRTAMKKARQAAAAGDAQAAMEAFRAAVPQIDSMVQKGILNKNAAARYKHRINERIKTLSA